MRNEIRVILTEKFLLYPVTCSAVFTCILSFEPVRIFWGNQWEMVALTLAVLTLLAAFASTHFIPVLQMGQDGIILRTDPCFSIIEKPTRYLFFAFDADRQPLFYTTTWSERHSGDSSKNNSSKYYIISTFKPSSNEFITTRSVLFQPEDDIGKKKKAYDLSEGYWVKAAGPDGQLKRRVSFTSIGTEGERKTDFGLIKSEFLEPIDGGLFLVSNCSSELSRWWYHRDCTLGYVHSKHVLLKQGEKSLLLEHENRVEKNCLKRNEEV